MASRTASAPEASRVSDHWAKLALEQQEQPNLRAEIGWLDSPIVLERYTNPKITGHAKVNWFEWAVRSYVPPDTANACTLGCGDGGLERHARRLKLQAHFDSYDISEGAVEVARRQAERDRWRDIDYRQADLNTIEFEPSSYDVFFASMTLHHVAELERLYRQMDKALRPGGLVIFNEFVGPRKFQWTGLQLAIVNRLLAALPERLRRDRTRPGELKHEVRRPSIEEMDAIDPSESVLSDRIMPLAHRFFEPVEIRDYGGTILHLLLDRIVGNFDPDRPQDVEILQDFFDLETLCLKTGVLRSDFTCAVFRKSRRR